MSAIDIKDVYTCPSIPACLSQRVRNVSRSGGTMVEQQPQDLPSLVPRPLFSSWGCVRGEKNPVWWLWHLPSVTINHYSMAYSNKLLCWHSCTVTRVVWLLQHTPTPVTRSESSHVEAWGARPNGSRDLSYKEGYQLDPLQFSYNYNIQLLLTATTIPSLSTEASNSSSKQGELQIELC